MFQQSCYRVFPLAALSLALAMAISIAQAGKYNKTLSIGDAAPGWTDLKDPSGKTHSQADLKDKDVIIVAFLCNTCEYAVAVEDRMNALHKKLAANGKCAIVAINPNKVEGDSLEKMAEKIKEKSFQFAYVHDDDAQSTAKAFGATRTPEFFVLNKDRKIVYMGALDDNPDEAKAQRNYIHEAVGAALAGKAPEVTETVPIGCTVRYQRDRRKKTE
ncbi:thiol-disulfide oxidoreductase [Anatilimnocola aggregata]|uniref:Thiol-disulfide oxidoreductase n=1 Tax=Anatilimnocola aggregata TaxID=2528021 RepID=A0A517YDD8_9BACT|nr:thioredoxin family protein [Anatilimnocola aggregata]QDU28251.1 thiol-disulfide oxidoreductase [Anatilimnocola aggregata]